MKKYLMLLQLVVVMFFFPNILSAQIDVLDYIGKSQPEIISKLGKPAYVDDSNSSMVMTFYKSVNSGKTFVSDENGTYQAEGTQYFDSEENCKSTLHNYITELIKQGFSVDTLSVSAYTSEKLGIICSYNYSLNSISNKYEISVIAHKKLN